MLHAAVGQAQNEASKRRSDSAAAERLPATARREPRSQGNQARLRMSTSSALQRPSRMPMLQRKCACGGTCADCSQQDKLQRKAAIGEPGDAFEQEADRVADQVMRRPAPVIEKQGTGGSDGSTIGSTREATPRIQRLANDGDNTGEVASDFASRLGTGAPLDAASRGFFEPRFGHDFGRVRIHDGPQAATAAADVQARAFTLGRDVVFAAGEHDPRSERGKRLLAHELTHVVQQERSQAPALQRASHDFDIRGKFDHSASFPNFAFFLEGSSTLDPDETAKVDAFALPAIDVLTLNGFASEEGSAAANLAAVQARLDAVADRLVLKGHDASKITKVPLASSGEGRIDYRRMRAVEILKPGAPSAVPSAAAPATAACGGSNETDFTDAVDEAGKMIDKSVTALTVPVDATMTPLLDRFFRGWAAADAATIKSNLSDIKTQLALLLPAANHQCGTIKYAACESGSEAQNIGSGNTAMMTMCPTFFNPAKSSKARGGTLVHEASHGTPGLVTDDNAYKHERLIEFLNLAAALQNSDSYAMLVRLFDLPGSVNVGPATPDPLTGGMTAAEQTAAREAMAWMEKWLIWSYQEMSALYDTIHESITAGSWTNTYYQATMGLAAPLFGLTAPPALPTKTDQVKMAAIHDRFHIMRATEWSKAVTLHKVAAGPEKWAAGPGPSVDLGPAFFSDSPRGRLDRMLTAIATATPDVSPPFVAKYVALADKIRTHMGGGAP